MKPSPNGTNNPGAQVPDIANTTRATGILEIDLGALVRNYRLLCRMAGKSECAAVIKADAYGLGVEPVAKALSGAGCRTFFVATPDEAVCVRKLLPDATLYVLYGLLKGSGDDYITHGLRPVLGSLAEISEWQALPAGTGTPPAALHVDTGMNRLGLDPDELQILAAEPDRLAGMNIALVMSHFACADEPDHPKNEIQRMAFEHARTVLPPAPASLANSAGIFLGQENHFDIVRPGIALYGGRAVNGSDKPTETVVTLGVQILQIRETAGGMTVGYGAERTLQGRRRIATIAAGYADGLPRRMGASNDAPGAMVYCAGRHVPIVGRVSMDLITIDITDIPEGTVHRGDLVEFFGPNIDIDDVADRIGTISYELLTQLGNRYERRTINEPRD